MSSGRPCNGTNAGTASTAIAAIAAIVAVGAVGAIAACGSLVPATLPDRDPGSAASDASIARFAVLLNAQRAREGCGPLAWDAEVATVAASHSRDMVERGYMSHVSPDGLDPFDRLRNAGIAFVAAAENLAFGASTGDEIFAQWMGSPSHRANMLSCRYTAQGVGRHGNHWTQLLVRPPPIP